MVFYYLEESWLKLGTNMRANHKDIKRFKFLHSFLLGQQSYYNFGSFSFHHFLYAFEYQNC